MPQGNLEGYTLEQLLAEKQRRAQGAKSTSNQIDINSLLQKAIGNQSFGKRMGMGAANALSILGGGQPIKDTSQDLYQDIAKTALTEQVKSQMSPDYVVSYDSKTGQPVFTKTPGNIKNAPFYASPIGQEYYGARTAQAGAQGQQAQVETDIMNQVLPQVKAVMSGQPGQQVIPGTKIQAGPITIPLNPELTEAESRGFAAAPIINDYANEFLGYVNAGVLGEGDAASVARGLAIDSDKPFTSHPNLYGGDRNVQASQSAMLRLKNATVFSDAGKQLTNQEKGIVFSLWKVTGKTPEQIKRDIPEGIRKFNEFVAAKMGGMFGYQPGQASQAQPIQPDDFSNMSDKDLQRIAGGG